MRIFVEIGFFFYVCTSSRDKVLRMFVLMMCIVFVFFGHVTLDGDRIGMLMGRWLILIMLCYAM